MVVRVSAQVNIGGALAKFDSSSRRVRAAVVVALEESGRIVQAEAQRSILDGPKSGRVYQKYNPRRSHQASAPGQPPANDLGWLASNIVVDRADILFGRIIIASLAAYSKALEYGTKHIKPRSFMRRALGRTRAAVQRAFVLAMRRQLG